MWRGRCWRCWSDTGGGRGGDGRGAEGRGIAIEAVSFGTWRAQLSQYPPAHTPAGLLPLTSAATHPHFTHFTPPPPLQLRGGRGAGAQHRVRPHQPVLLPERAAAGRLHKQGEHALGAQRCLSGLCDASHGLSHRKEKAAAAVPRQCGGHSAHTRKDVPAPPDHMRPPTPTPCVQRAYPHPHLLSLVWAGIYNPTC